MTIAEIINELSKYSLTAKVLDFEDRDYAIADIVYDPDDDEIYVKFEPVHKKRAAM